MGDRTIIADASCLIALFNIGEFDILRRLFGNITITPDVHDEFGQAVPEWVRVVSPADHAAVMELCELIDMGEASAIILAQETPDHLLIIDDREGRLIASQRNLRYIGTLGLLTRAKREGVIAAVLPFYRKLLTVEFRMSSLLVEDWLRENGETL